MRKLTETTKKAIEQTVGLPFDQIVSQSLELTEKHIEKRIGKKLKVKNIDYN